MIYPDFSGLGTFLTAEALQYVKIYVGNYLYSNFE